MVLADNLTWGTIKTWTVLTPVLIGVLATSTVHAVEPPRLPTSVRPAPIESSSDPSYSLDAGDRIQITVFQAPQYSGEFAVLINGSVNLPVVGGVSLRGLTLTQAEEAIATRYASILRRPIVTVSLTSNRPVQIGIAGEVNHPGSYTLGSDRGAFPTLTQVLETAGGIRQAADLRQVEVRRLQSTGTVQVIRVDLWQLLQTGDLAYDVALRDGDTIFIPTATNPNLIESAQVADASFAARDSIPINIAVVGEVFRPGPYTVTGTARTAQAGVPGGASGGGSLPTVTRAIQVAGGITPTANIRKVEIRRLTRTGVEQTLEVDLWKLLENGDLQQDVILQDRDTVVVPVATAIDATEASQIAAASFSPNTIRINVVGEVNRPGVVEVPPNTPLNQGLLAAGGFNNRASQSSVELIRLNDDGSVLRQQIRVDFAQRIDTTNNPPLRNNDVIIVRRSGVAGIGDTLDTLISPLARFVTLFSLPLNFFRLF